jgi:multiple sugar transport system ATP-binding protein
MLYVTHDQVEALTLGDRIAVMRAGRLQQVGPPGDLYSRPRNLFVAGFIGSPSMNFLPAELDGDRLRSPVGDLSVSDELRRRLAAGPSAGGRGLIIGIRPEDFEDAMLVGDRASGHRFKTRIDVLESLGSEYNAHFEVESPRVASTDLEELAEDRGTADLDRAREGAQMIARLPRASQIRQGQEAELWFDTARLYLFDAGTGRSLL